MGRLFPIAVIVTINIITVPYTDNISENFTTYRKLVCYYKNYNALYFPDDKNPKTFSYSCHSYNVFRVHRRRLYALPLPFSFLSAIWRALTVQLNPIDQVRGSCQANTFAYVYLIYEAYT